MSSTYGQALLGAQSSGLDRLDAQLLLLHALGKIDTERAWLLAHDDDALDITQATTYQALVSRRAAGEPLAYLVGYKEFFGLRLAVDARVLIPRPDTETLVHWALDTLRAAGSSSPAVLDLGTGSGALAVAIADAISCSMTAVDASEGALAVASGNAGQLGVNVAFVQSDWFSRVEGRFNCIVSNPPYIAADDLHLAALRHEPLSALSAGSDGLSDIRTIAKGAPMHLHPNGWLLVEHGYDQASAVRDLLIQHGFKRVQSRVDLAGISRCTGGQWLAETS